MYHRSGLGLQAFGVPNDIEGSLQILQNMIFHWRDRARRLSPPDEGLQQQVDRGASYWAQASEMANFDGNFTGARAAIANGIGYMHGIAKVVMKAEGARSTSGPFAPAIVAEMDRLTRGSSVMEQARQILRGTKITDGVASMIEPLSPVVADAVRKSGWIVPLALAGGGIFLVSRLR